jgi:23S rRNA (pseudouridine1915-N3)-methyltransferase
MKLQLWSVGKNHDPDLKPVIDDFSKRLTNYFPTSWTIIAPPKQSAGATVIQIKAKEADLILDQLDKSDVLILLDERGKQLTSEGVAQMIQARANEGRKQLVFLIGGAFGVDEKVARRADFSWSLSSLTFPHQMVRLLLAEQLYRACTILKNEKYHHS